MSKELISNGNDFVVEWVDRVFGGTRRTVLQVSGLDGSLVMGDLSVDKNGVVTIAGSDLLGGVLADDTTLTANKQLVAGAGTGLLDFSAASGVFKTSTGTNTLGGNVVIAGSKTLTTGTGLTTFSGKQASTATANLIADPGASGAIPVTASGSCALTSGGSETRSLAAPTFVGQRLSLTCDVDGGSLAVTSATAINQAGNTHMALNDVGDMIVLEAMQVGGTKVWRVVANDGVALS